MYYLCPTIFYIMHYLYSIVLYTVCSLFQRFYYAMYYFCQSVLYTMCYLCPTVFFIMHYLYSIVLYTMHSLCQCFSYAMYYLCQSALCRVHMSSEGRFLWLYTNISLIFTVAYSMISFVVRIDMV